jgi:hypothetical protein
MLLLLLQKLLQYGAMMSPSQLLLLPRLLPAVPLLLLVKM